MTRPTYQVTELLGDGIGEELCRARASAQTEERAAGRTILLTVFRRSRVIILYFHPETVLRSSTFVDVMS